MFYHRLISTLGIYKKRIVNIVFVVDTMRDYSEPVFDGATFNLRALCGGVANKVFRSRIYRDRTSSATAYSKVYAVETTINVQQEAIFIFGQIDNMLDLFLTEQ